MCGSLARNSGGSIFGRKDAMSSIFGWKKAIHTRWVVEGSRLLIWYRV